MIDASACPERFATWRLSTERDQCLLDRVAIVGDVLNGMNLMTAWPGLHEPPAVFCTDVAENRHSIRRLAELNPRLLCFGHGPPLRDMKKFDRFLKQLDAKATKG